MLPLLENYHTHTFRCGHAVGTEREYVESAIRAGIKVLGFSDHTPYPGAGESLRPIRMDLSELDGYCQSVLDLRDEYRKDIRICLGLEVEYYPALFDALMAELEKRPLDYLILAQHFTRNQHDGVHVSMPGDEVLEDYTRQLISGMESGHFTYVAHPDIVCHGEDPVRYEERMRRICRRARELELPLEINLLGLREHRSYPYAPFWKIAAEEGCLAVIGCDAHRPEDLSCPEALGQARALAASCGIQVLSSVPLRAPFPAR